MKQDNKTPEPAQWLGYFYGHDLTFLHAEVLAIQHVPATLLKKEAELMRTKWFDYRRMHPTKATYFLASCYAKAYGNAIAVMKDSQMGLYHKGFKGMDFMQTKEALSFWRLRQSIDKLGIRYDFYLRKAMDWCIENGWRRPPRPSQLASNPDMVSDIMLAWEEECAARIQFCKDDRYKVRSFFGHADQIAYEQFIVQAIKQRPQPRYGLNSALYVEDAIRIETALTEFGERVVEEAVSLSA